MSTTVDNKEIKYRAFEYIPYVANPIDIDQQYMNIYVPEEYFNNGTVNGTIHKQPLSSCQMR